MKRKLLFKAASFLFRYAFPLYKILYYRFKNKQDAFQIRLMQQLIKEGENVLDIGANIGYYADIMSTLVGKKGTVHCFEPDELNFKYLSINTKAKINVILNKKAVAEDNGKFLIYTSDVINVEHTTYKPEHFDSTYLVEKTAIDKYIAQKFSVSFIKMDIQGAELKALEGMKQTLQSNDDIILMTEVAPYCLKNNGSTPQQIIDFIQSLRFNIFLINQNSLKELSYADVINFKTDEEYFYNILCSRKSLKELNLTNQI